MIKTKDINGNSVMLDNSEEEMYKLDLVSYKALQLYGILKDQQFEWFIEIKYINTLISYFNKVAAPYYAQARYLILNGTPAFIAEETAWCDLVQRVCI